MTKETLNKGYDLNGEIDRRKKHLETFKRRTADSVTRMEIDVTESEIGPNGMCQLRDLYISLINSGIKSLEQEFDSL